MPNLFFKSFILKDVKKNLTLYYMTELTSQITQIINKNKPNIKQNSLNTYKYTLIKFLADKLTLDDINNDYKKVIEHFNSLNKADTTKKNILIAIMVIANNKAKEIYEPMLKEYNNLYFKKMNNGEYTDNQKNKQVSPETLAKILEKYRNKANEIIKKNNINDDEHNLLTNYIILELYTSGDIPPLRNDYREIYITKKIKDTTDINKNWYHIPTGSFIINNYKTAKSNGSISFEVNQKLRDFINKYISYNKNVPLLFFNTYLNPYSSQAWTNRINKIFLDNIGIKISSSMLRHIYTTNKYGIIKKQLENDSKIMGHSVNTNLNIYNKG